MATAPTIDVLYETYDDIPLLTASRVPQALEQAPFTAPSDWQVEAGTSSQLTVVVRANDGVAQQTRAPVFWLTYSREAESLEIQFVEIVDDGVRLYADAMLAQGSPEAVTAGRGFAGGPAFVLDTGRFLARGTYNDGTPGAPTITENRARALQATARQLLLTLRNR